MKLNLYGHQPIITPRDPQVPMEAANKNYVDNSIAAHANNISLHLTPAQNLLLDSLTVTAEELNSLSGLNTATNIQSQIDSKVSKAGDTMTGALTLSADPINGLHAATKQYVDAGDATKVAKAGDTMTGALTLHGNPTSNLHAAPKQYVDSTVAAHASDDSLHLTTSQNTFLDGITVTHTEVNQLAGVTSNVQTQLDAKVSKAGDTMTGFLTLHANPTANLHAVTKQYVDAADATKVAKAGDTMTGALTLHGDPTANLHAATKQYVDSTVATHASDNSLHLTASQNTFLDGITVSHTEVNQLAGVTSNVQAQLDSKFDKTGGLITGNITLDTDYTIYVSKVPAGSTEVVNKAYVDSLLSGLEWKDPVTDINLVADNLNTPPASPVIGDVYIIGNAPTGAWVNKAGYATFWNGTSWVFLQNRPVAVNDRFGVAFTTSTTVSANLTTYVKKIVTITNNTPGSIAYSVDNITSGSTTLVFDPDSSKFGISYTYTDEGNWVPTNTSVNLVAGDALSLSGNIINVNYGSGLKLESDVLKAKLNTLSGLNINASDEIEIKLDGNTISASASGIKVADNIISNLNDKLSKTGTETVTGSVTFSNTANLKTQFTPTVATDVVNKGYVDTADNNLQSQITSLQTTVNVLNSDPVTKTYVDTQDATKVAKAGDTMTGALTLHGNPTSNLHAAPKQYVDSVVAAHASDDSLHLTTSQNTFLDGITVTHTEVNQLAGVTSNVQTQLDAKVSKAGDTMTGALTLHDDPVAALHAATKQYVDVSVAAKVSKAGDTMTGFLTLHADPTANLHAATKQYVDSNLSSHATNDNLHLTASQNAFLDGITVSHTEVNQLTGITSNVQTQLDSKLNLSGGVMTGFITLHANPTANLHAATKQYVDAADATKVAKAGDTMTGYLTLHANPTDNLHAATKEYVDNNITSANTYTNTQIATRVAKAGDTMTGFLTLHADPTANLHAATKQYVDSSITTLTNYVDTQDSNLQSQITSLQSTVNTLNTDPVTKSYVDSKDATKVNKAGDTMTGYLTLHADPSQAMHAVTKQYVDAVVQGLQTKPSVRLATTSNLNATYNNGSLGVNSTLTGNTNGILTIDGKTVNVGDRILVRAQTNALENGDYVVQQVGSTTAPFILKRVETVDESNEIPGSYFYVYDGDTLKGTGWVLTVDNPVTFTIGTDNIYVNQFSGQGSIIAGAGLTLTGNTLDINTANSSRIVVNADNIDLAVTGVTPGTYTKVTVDGYGRVMSATNPNTLAGYGITDGQPLNANLTSLSNVTTNGLLVRNNSNEIVTNSITVNGVGLSITNANGASSGNITISSNATDNATPNTLVSRDASGNFSANTITANLNGNANTATTLATSRDFAITGDITAPAVGFNGSGNVTLTATLVNSGVTAGTYTKVTVDAKGRVISGDNPTYISDLGVTDVYTKAQVDALISDLVNQINELRALINSK